MDDTTFCGVITFCAFFWFFALPPRGLFFLSITTVAHIIILSMLVGLRLNNVAIVASEVTDRLSSIVYRPLPDPFSPIGFCMLLYKLTNPVLHTGNWNRTYYSICALMFTFPVISSLRIACVVYAAAQAELQRTEFYQDPSTLRGQFFTALALSLVLAEFAVLPELAWKRACFLRSCLWTFVTGQTDEITPTPTPTPQITVVPHESADAPSRPEPINPPTPASRLCAPNSIMRRTVSFEPMRRLPARVNATAAVSASSFGSSPQSASDMVARLKSASVHCDPTTSETEGQNPFSPPIHGTPPLGDMIQFTPPLTAEDRPSRVPMQPYCRPDFDTDEDLYYLSPPLRNIKVSMASDDCDVLSSGTASSSTQRSRESSPPDSPPSLTVSSRSSPPGSPLPSIDTTCWTLPMDWSPLKSPTFHPSSPDSPVLVYRADIPLVSITPASRLPTVSSSCVNPQTVPSRNSTLRIPSLVNPHLEHPFAGHYRRRAGPKRVQFTLPDQREREKMPHGSHRAANHKTLDEVERTLNAYASELEGCRKQRFVLPSVATARRLTGEAALWTLLQTLLAMVVKRSKTDDGIPYSASLSTGPVAIDIRERQRALVVRTLTLLRTVRHIHRDTAADSMEIDENVIMATTLRERLRMLARNRNALQDIAKLPLEYQEYHRVLEQTQQICLHIQLTSNLLNEMHGLEIDDSEFMHLHCLDIISESNDERSLCNQAKSELSDIERSLRVLDAQVEDVPEFVEVFLSFREVIPPLQNIWTQVSNVQERIDAIVRRADPNAMRLSR